MTLKVLKKNSNGVSYLETITDFQNVTKTKRIQSNCVSIAFINKGDNTANINGLKLANNESVSVSQNNGCIDRSQYNISFDADGTESNLVIIKILPKNQS